MPAEVRSQLAATVWKVVAGAGDVVHAGDTLLILESMKMEIPVLADVNGTVLRVVATEGATVREGDLLAVIE